KRQGIRIDISHLKECFERLKAKHDFLLVEGAGGLFVPIQGDYLMSDLARDLGLEVLIVSRLSLGTINHTLLTIRQARSSGLKVRGVILNQGNQKALGIPERTNPETIEKLGDVQILGSIPYLKSFEREKILCECEKQINVEKILDAPTVRFDVAKKLVRDDKKYIWHPFTQMQDWLKSEPLVIEEARGCYLKDTQGRWYLDGVSSLWVNVHGHQHKMIDEAIQAQLKKVSHSTFLGLSNVPAIELAKRLMKIVPLGLKKVFYSDNGSTAVEVAIKIAYQYWQNIGKKEKKVIVHLAHSYHGDTLGSVSVGGIDLFHKVYRDLIFKAVKWPTPYPDVFGDKEKFENQFFASVKKLEQFFKTSHSQIAALVIEPIVQGAAGMIVWPKGVLRELSRVCRRYDVLLIVDEVATGFGRTGKMFACAHEGVSPDILCLAKGMTGGYLPLAATLTTQRVYDGFLCDYKSQKSFFHGHTYTGNPLACAAAIANLNVFQSEQTLKRLVPKIKFLTDQLKPFKHLPHVGDIRQKGFMVGIELVKDKQKRNEYLWQEKIGIKVCERALREGVILRPLGNVIVLMPPLSITRPELEKICAATLLAIREVTE
ncbi:MAG: adenosylmethionine--8-amino-7-oxononanoate transaminase, partial [Candidatus Omnitrophica bacterium]|nr:adenosylmethionine--8-amino-7-oxononanoate transaminase [Candidatus Omnitrophota bacterium]